MIIVYYVLIQTKVVWILGASQYREYSQYYPEVYCNFHGTYMITPDTAKPHPIHMLENEH